MSSLLTLFRYFMRSSRDQSSRLSQWVRLRQAVSQIRMPSRCQFSNWRRSELIRSISSMPCRCACSFSLRSSSTSPSSSLTSSCSCTTESALQFMALSSSASSSLRYSSSLISMTSTSLTLQQSSQHLSAFMRWTAAWCGWSGLYIQIVNYNRFTMASPFALIEEYLWYHAFTVAAVAVFLLLILVHRRGSEQNLAVVREYKEILDPFLGKNFSEYDGEVLVESANIVKLYPSGRESCLFAIFAFALVPRQQILSHLFNSLFIHLKDELVIEIPIVNELPISLTMAIIRKKNIKELTKRKYPDIKQLCKEYRPIINPALNVPDSHSILVEKVEHFRYFLHNEEEIQLWKEHGRSVKMVYMSDVNPYSRYPMTVRMVINLGKDVLPLVGWLVGYVDRMSKARMTSGQRREARKRRQGLNLKLDQ